MENLYLSIGEGETEARVTVSANIIEQINRWIDEIDRRHGPDRTIGPVEFIISNGPMRVSIGTQKQGDYVLRDDDGFLVVEEGPFGLPDSLRVRI